jgi:phosphoribosylanthranilate isomerase
VIASGGVAALDHLRALAELVPAGLEGVIVGKALYVGAFTLEAALAVAAEHAVAGADPAGSGR